MKIFFSGFCVPLVSRVYGTAQLALISLKQFAKHRESGLITIVLLMAAILSIVADGFMSSSNLFNVLKQTTLVTIIAVGQTYIITSGGIDLSVGHTMTLSSMILSYLLVANVATPLAIIAGIMASVLVGLLNGVLITTLNIPAFIRIFVGISGWKPPASPVIKRIEAL